MALHERRRVSRKSVLSFISPKDWSTLILAVVGLIGSHAITKQQTEANDSKIEARAMVACGAVAAQVADLRKEVKELKRQLKHHGSQAAIGPPEPVQQTTLQRVGGFFSRIFGGQ